MAASDLSIVAGQLLSSLVNASLVPAMATEVSWRLGFGLGAVPAAAMLAAWLCMPETPRWLARRRSMGAGVAYDVCVLTLAALACSPGRRAAKGGAWE